MGRPKASFYKAPRPAEDAVPPQVLPILVSIAAVATPINEGAGAQWRISVNRQGNAPTPFSVGIRTMTAAELGVSDAELAGGTDFSTSFVQALTDSAAATTGVTVSGDFSNAILTFDATFVSPFTITRTTFNNPAEQGDKHSGLLIHSLLVQPTSGSITVDAGFIAILDQTGSAAVPTNVSVPVLSDDTPTVGVENIGSDGVWNGSPTLFLSQWQRRGRYDDAILDFDYTRAQFYFNGVEYASLAEMVSAGFYTVDATGDRVNLTGLVPSVYTILFKGTNAASIITEENQTALVLDDGADADWDDEVVLLDRYYFAGTSLILRTIVRNANTSTGSMSSSANIAAAANNAVVKLASRLKANSSAMSINGGLVIADPSVVMPTVNRMVIGGTEDAARGVWDGSIDRIMLLARDPTNSELQALDVPVDGDIVTATAASYTPQAADLGIAIRKGVVARNVQGDSAIAYSAWSSPVAAGGVVVPSPPANTGVPVVSDTTPTVNQTVTGSDGTWSNSPTSFLRKWQEEIASVATDISGAVSSSYQVTSGRLNRPIRYGVNATNAGGSSGYVFSAWTTAVAAAPAGSLTDVTLSTGLAYAPVDGPVNTVICAFQGVGGPIVTAAPATGGDAGGRFKVTGSSPSFNLACGSVVPDFRGEINPGYNARTGLSFYDTLWHFTGNQGGAGFDKAIRIWANWPLIAPTGGGAATPELKTVDGMRSAALSGASNKVYHCDPTSIGVQANTSCDVAGHNITFQGHRRAFFGKNGCWELRGPATNIIFRDMQFARGADLGASLSDSDSFRCRGGGALESPPGRETEVVLFENCNFLWSIDECVSIINTGPFPRLFKFYRCLFAEALTESGLSDSATKYVTHDYGPLSYHHVQHLVWVKCLIGKFGQRMPMLKAPQKGGLVQNCIISKWNPGATRGATLLTSQTRSNGQASSVIVRANLYDPNRYNEIDYQAARLNPIRLSRIGSGNFVYIPESGRFANHFYRQDVPFSWAADPVLRSANVNLSDSDPTNLVDFEPFKCGEDATCMPTETLAERTALYANVIDYVGVRARDGSGNLVPGDLAMSHEGHRIVSRFRAGQAWTNQTGAYPDAPQNKGGVFTPENISIVYDTSLPT